VIQGLGITTLELTTLAFAFSMFLTSFFWFHKPKDVISPIIIETPHKIEDILKDARIPPFYEYKYTPLDFISRREWSISILWAYYCRLNEKIKVPVFLRRRLPKPATRIRSDNFPPLDTIPELIIGTIFLLIYSSLFMLAWNFDFPTVAEKILWRTFSCSMVAFPFLAGAVFLVGDHAYFLRRRSSELPMQTQSKDDGAKKSRISSFLKSISKGLRNIEEDHDPMLDVPLRILFPATVICALYSVTRGYILLEDIISLRSLSPNLLREVQWFRHLPNI
jgi:hypothetical protein